MGFEENRSSRTIARISFSEIGSRFSHEDVLMAVSFFFGLLANRKINWAENVNYRLIVAFYFSGINAHW